VKEQEIADLMRHRMEQAQTALDDAAFLLNGNRSPQSIVNRSYYAMFYAALALLQKVGKVPSKHIGVISLFDTEFALKGVFPKEMSKNFHKAFELRQVSDYKSVTSISREKSEETLRSAIRFVETVRAYLASSV
jgi:uncharacterized protein (UPF0332 family)